MKARQFCSWEEAVSWLLTQPNQQELVQACYYDQPHQAAADRYWQSNEWQAIRPYLPSQPGYALDIGAGNGISSYALARDGWQVSALEPDPSNLVGTGAIQRLANENKLPITVVQEFGEALPFSDHSFDLVFARQVLHHAQDLGQLCREIHRVLRPGGKFIAVRDHVVSSKQDLERFFDIHPLHHLYGGENAFLLEEYRTAIEGAHLKLEQVISPFSSVINYAPRSKADIKVELQQRLRKLPLGTLPANILDNETVFSGLLQALGWFDHRPGRLYSFIAHRPLLHKP